MDFTNGNPIPPLSTSSGLYYNGGGGASSTLVLTGGTFTSEVDNASGPGAGDVTWTTGAVKTYLNYAGLTPVADNTVVTTYTFNDNAGPDSSYTLEDDTLGLIPGPALEFISTGSGFETTDVNNKANVKFVDTSSTPSGGVANILYNPTGLATLNITVSCPNQRSVRPELAAWRHQLVQPRRRRRNGGSLWPRSG